MNPVDRPGLTTAGERDAVWCERFVSLQGEGPLAGQRAAFVRLAHCNLACGYCDTDYSWSWAVFPRAEHTHIAPVSETAAWVRAQNTDLVIVTGGEPLLQAEAVQKLAEQCAPARIQVETNGTRTPPADLVSAVTLFVVSPKLSNSNLPRSRRILPAVLRAWTEVSPVAWKFVATGPEDVAEIDQLVHEYRLRARVGHAGRPATRCCPGTGSGTGRARARPGMESEPAFPHAVVG